MHTGFAKAFVLLMALLAGGAAWAQQPVTPCFTVSNKVGCAPLTIKPTDCSGVPAELVYYDFGTGQGPGPAKEFTYTRPGKYAVTQYINTVGGGGARSDGNFIVEVVEPKNPTFTIDLCQNRNVRITVTDGNFAEYEVDLGGAAKQIVKANTPLSFQFPDEAPRDIVVQGYFRESGTACGRTAQRITPLNTPSRGNITQVRLLANGRAELQMSLAPNTAYRLVQRNVITGQSKNFDLPPNQATFVSPDATDLLDRYVYTLAPFNICTNQLGGSSNPVGTINLLLAATEGSNLLTWNAPAHAGFVNYTLYRNNQVLRTFDNIGDLRFEDTNLRCGQRYCYRLEATFYGGDAKAISQEQCATTSLASRPQPLRELNVSVVNSRALLTWRPPAARPNDAGIRTMVLMRSVNGGPFQKINLPASTVSPYADSLVNTSGATYCYKLTYIDECGNTAPETSPACTMLLRASTDEQNINLNWENPFGNAVTFIVEKVEENGSIVSSSAPVSGTSFAEAKDKLDRQVNYYRIRALINSPSGGLIALYSNIVRVRVDASLTLPNAFSPNDDGLNDTFGVEATFVQNFALQVFNRWGELIYFTDDPASRWDGNFQGQPVPPGQYVYVIEAQDSLGRKLNRKGMLTVIK